MQNIRKYLSYFKLSNLLQLILTNDYKAIQHAIIPIRANIPIKSTKIIILLNLVNKKQSFCKS